MLSPGGPPRRRLQRERLCACGAVTVEGEVHHDSWENPREKQVALTDSVAPEMPFRGGGFPYAVSDSRRAMAEFLVRHGG